MNPFRNPAVTLLVFAGLVSFALAGLEPGNVIKLTLRGIDAAEQGKVNGEYRLGESGAVRLPLLGKPVPAKGLTTEQFARAAEAAYKAEGIYTTPAIEVEAVNGIQGNQGPDKVSVSGQVRRGGETPFRKDMTVVQAIDAVGGLNDFGGRNITLLRDKKQYCLDFRNLAHKNIVLRPNDSLQVAPKGALKDNWKGTDQAVKALLE